DALQRVPAGVEDQRVPRRRSDRVGELRDASPTEVRAGVVGRLHHRTLHLVVGREPLDLAGAFQAVVQPAITPDVVVLEVDRTELRIAPREAVPLTEPL